MDKNANSQVQADKKKGFGGIAGWFSALAGKQKPQRPERSEPVKSTSEVKVSEVKANKPLVITDLSKEDSVKEDFTKLRTLFGKYKSKASEKITPIAEKGAEKIIRTVSSSEGVVDKPFYKKLLKIFFVVFFILILVFVGATLFNIFKRKEVIKAPEEPTATPIPYKPTKTSVYAKDESVLKMEEDIDVLEKELVRVSVRENDLQPPRLDFDVNFK